MSDLEDLAELVDAQEFETDTRVRKSTKLSRNWRKYQAINFERVTKARATISSRQRTSIRQRPPAPISLAEIKS